jgi:hypothetical protein
MDGDSKRIKNFDEFMYGSKMRRFLDLTIITGTIKGGFFFGKSKPFELMLYHTQLKHRILDYRIDGATLGDLGIEIKVGDHIEDLKRWAESKGYKIEEIYR